jgi:ubiquinol-cytochrome c reductase cytochrome c subunit
VPQLRRPGRCADRGQVRPEHHARLAEEPLPGDADRTAEHAGTLRVEDKQAIIKYVTTLAEAENPGGASLGSVGPVTEGIVAWLVGLGALIGAAVWIGVKAS